MNQIQLQYKLNIIAYINKSHILSAHGQNSNRAKMHMQPAYFRGTKAGYSLSVWQLLQQAAGNENNELWPFVCAKDKSE